MAVLTITTIPMLILFAVFQEKLMDSMTIGAVKGLGRDENMKKWFSWIIKRYTQLKLDKKIALLYTALILIVSVTLTISITHTAGDIILRDRKDLVQQNVNVAKESVETELNTILNTGLGIVVSNAVQNFYTSSATSISDMENIRMLIQMAMDRKFQN